jgi:integrase
MKGIYQKKGWWYYQAPKPKDDKRPKAIALGTQDELQAINLAANHASGTELIRVETQKTMRTILPLYYAEKSEDAKKSRQGRKQILDAFTELMGNPMVRDIDQDLIRKWRAKLTTTGGSLKSNKPCSPSTLTSYLITLKAFLSWAVEKKLIRVNPVKDMKRQTTVRVTRRQEFLTVSKRDELIETPSKDYIGLILHLGAYAGLRDGEMQAFNDQWLWISDDWTAGSISIQETKITYTDGSTGWWRPKAKEVRTIPLHPKLLAFLKTYGIRKPYMLAPHKTLWPTEDKHSKRFDAKRPLITHGKRCGIPNLHVHMLRHTFGTHLSQSGMTMNNIAALLGNTLRVTEDHYLGFSPSRSIALDCL